MADWQRYHLLLYLENLGSGQRHYLVRRGDWSQLTDHIAEPVGRIVARGRLDAPVVMTCNAPSGQRIAAAWC